MSRYNTDSDTTGEKSVGEWPLMTLIACSVAGADTSKVVRHRDDVIKYSVIGYAIIMTMLLGILCGYAAAWYFSHSHFVAALFGLFWGLVVMCIDRALVVTYRKNPESQDKSLFGRVMSASKVILPRAVLAFCVAYVMSIPAELIVFEDFINTELPGYTEHLKKENARASYLSEQNSSLDIERQENLASLASLSEQVSSSAKKLSAEEKDIQEIEQRIANLWNTIDSPTSERYISAKSSLDNAKKILESHPNAGDSIQAEKDKKTANIIIEKEKKNHKEAVLEKIRADSTELNKRNSQYLELHEKHTRLTELQGSRMKRSEDLADRADRMNAYNDSIAGKVDRNIAATNQFTLGYAVLQYAVSRTRPVYEERKETVPLSDGSVNEDGSPRTYEKEYTVQTGVERANPSEYFLLCLIRVMFFVLELIPTVVKVVAPVGGYEYEIYAGDSALARYYESDMFRDAVTSRQRAAADQDARLEQDRLDMEREMHSRLLKKVAAAQEEVASRVIEDWRREQLDGVKSGDDTSSPTIVHPAPIQTDLPEAETI